MAKKRRLKPPGVYPEEIRVVMAETSGDRGELAGVPYLRVEERVETLADDTVFAVYELKYKMRVSRVTATQFLLEED